MHDPPPGYQPPKARESLKDRQREAREDWILMRVATVVLTLVVVAFVVIMLVIIATHS
jgi:succinate dehydrogenase hydrophobic anchor subunit